MIAWCPRCEDHVELITTIEEDEDFRGVYHQCKHCYMILCWEMPDINILDVANAEPESE